MPEVAGYHVERWLSADQVAEMRYADYWNDEQREHGKEWDITGGGFDRMEDYVEHTGLGGDLDACIEALGRATGHRLQGVGIDLAAGNLWAAPRLLAAQAVERLYCVEFSEHRLLKLGPAVLGHYGIPPERVVLAFGSFYELGLADGSADFAFMSQALHHADEPDRLLAEVARVLKPDGVVLVIGEHVPTVRAQLGRLLRGGFGYDELAGDHFYTRGQYRSMFRSAGFEHARITRASSDFQAFALWRG